MIKSFNSALAIVACKVLFVQKTCALKYNKSLFYFTMLAIKFSILIPSGVSAIIADTPDGALH